MRVVQVSAHYPPNFTSGGTLVPWRIARGLSARGHDVSVYAGRLEEGRPPLSTSSEVDDEGVDVRWVVTTPWTGWADRHNFDNPAVAEDFRAWLAQVGPDVVHLHSLQTLGGDLVAVAHESGAKVVVTMHDFWWSCARQFLVGTDGKPCSLVVDCGSCACQVTHEWLLERNGWLAERLEGADVVLAPSRSAAAVLAANGVNPDRLRVDENGVPVGTAFAEPRESRSDGPVRLLYAGGEDPMKGFDVLVDALSRVHARGDWSIDLYNVRRRLTDEHARSLPAFDPAELGAVLAAHDVLVLPSVMRESHSILTREALSAGLAVVCADSLGPEEVVEEGVNGLVVPAGDASALAEAITTVVDDPALVAAMQAQAGGVVVRTVDEQIDGLCDLYEELLEGQKGADGPVPDDGAVRAAVDGMLRRVLFVVGINGAPLRYRAHLPAEALATRGVQTRVLHYRDPAVVEAARWADAVVLYRVPATTQLLELVEDVRRRDRTVPVLYDVDDLIVDPGLRGTVHGLSSLSRAEEELWWHGVARYRTLLEVADGYVGSTNALCEHIGRLTGLPTYRYANGVGAALGRISERALQHEREDGPLRIGYFSGTTTHDEDWATIAPVVAALMAERPGLELWIGGHLTLGPGFDAVVARVRRFPMMDWTRLPDVLRQLDVNLAPLVLSSDFNEAKSAIKWLEAALVETPTVASATEPFREAIDQGRTGFLARGPEDWREALVQLLDDPVLRHRTGARARRSALLRWAPALQGATYQQLLRDALVHRLDVGPRVSAWEPVADDEPFDGAAAWVDPYPPAAGQVGAVPPWRRRLATVRRVYGSGGGRAVAGALWRRVAARR